MDTYAKKTDKLKKSVITGLAIAVALSAAGGNTSGGAQKQMFLFPQFTKTACAEKTDSGDEGSGSDDEDEIVYAFRIAEVFHLIFS